MNVAPGDLVLVKYRDLESATAMYQVVAVYDAEWSGKVEQCFYYFHCAGNMHLYSAPVSFLDEEGLEVTVLKL